MTERTLAGTVWGVFSPILIYYLLAMSFPQILGRLAGNLLLAENAMWLLAASNACMLPVFAWMYRQERSFRGLLWESESSRTGGDCLEEGSQRHRGRKFGVLDFFLVILGAVCISQVMNRLIGLTPLPQYFPGYQTVSSEIYSCSLFSQVAACVVSAGLLEETLMRGLVYNRLKGFTHNCRFSLIGSALIFGIFHGNVVQGLFAFMMGLLFAWIYETYHSLIPAIVAHMAVNGVAIFCEYMSL